MEGKHRHLAGTVKVSFPIFCTLFHREMVQIALCGWPSHTIPFIVGTLPFECGGVSGQTTYALAYVASPSVHGSDWPL